MCLSTDDSAGPVRQTYAAHSQRHHRYVHVNEPEPFFGCRDCPAHKAGTLQIAQTFQLRQRIGAFPNIICISAEKPFESLTTVKAVNRKQLPMRMPGRFALLRLSKIQRKRFDSSCKQSAARIEFVRKTFEKRTHLLVGVRS